MIGPAPETYYAARCDDCGERFDDVEHCAFHPREHLIELLYEWDWMVCAQGNHCWCPDCAERHSHECPRCEATVCDCDTACPECGLRDTSQEEE